MSLILEALRKSEAERRRGAVPDVAMELPPQAMARPRALPAWAQQTLAKHAEDPRAHVYSPEEWEAAATHDPLWNAAQTELVRTGTIHNYLRMLWGKKVIEWSRSPEEAYRTLVHLNNKYATDGRDPSSYTGILWCFGLFDRPWPPERPVLGTVRYMSSESAARNSRIESAVSPSVMPATSESEVKR